MVLFKILEKAIEINPEHGNAYSNRSVSKGKGFGDEKGACNDFKKAASLGDEYRRQQLDSNEGNQCRNME